MLAGLPRELAERLEEAFGARLQGMGDRVEARVKEKDVQRVLGEVLGAGAEVVSVTPHRESLETVFLHAVEEGSR